MQGFIQFDGIDETISKAIRVHWKQNLQIDGTEIDPKWGYEILWSFDQTIYRYLNRFKKTLSIRGNYRKILEFY